MTIGVIGESLIDVFTDASGAIVERPGGSPFNVAVALSRLDIEARLFTAIGNDAHGATLLSRLSEEGIALTRGASTAPTSAARALVDGDGRATYEFNLAWDPHFGDDWPALTVLHFGSLGSALTPGADEVRGVVDRYRGTALISYDPNWRDGLVVGDPRQLVDGNAARADVVKLSDDDAAAIYPGLDLEDIAHRLLHLGPALVVITKGAAGASAWTAKNEKHVGAATIDVVDTVGAGDAFMATLLSELADFDRNKVESLNRRELELVLEFASFVAGKTCEKAGADPPYIAELF
ncbi:MAG TPA: carbohydrate kinase [Mycobacteriales bacterium]|jgi:fructokinase|nr:carbohydrate kinase [Mycobacteriales bacterium]